MHWLYFGFLYGPYHMLLHLLYHVCDWQGLFEWRDVLARSEDESTGFILPNKVILEIGK